MYNTLSIIDNINSINIKCEDRYTFDNIPIPRVTEILSKMIHEEGLMNWANYLGLCKRIRYQTEMEKACNIGTQTHNAIEEYIKDGLYNKDSITDINDYNISYSINNAIKSFILWYEDISTCNTINILGMEEKLTCKWFGGTYDLLVELNGKKYLIDFKTSNHITYKYFLQLAAYRYMLNLDNINIDGCIILQLDKKYPGYEEYFLNFDNIDHLNFIESCTEAFLSLVYSYYNIHYVEQEYKKIFS